MWQLFVTRTESDSGRVNTRRRRRDGELGLDARAGHLEVVEADHYFRALGIRTSRGATT